MELFSILCIIFVVLGAASLIKAFVGLQVRDKRFNKGVKRKFNMPSFIYLIVAVVLIYLAFRFYYFS